MGTIKSRVQTYFDIMYIYDCSCMHTMLSTYIINFMLLGYEGVLETSILHMGVPMLFQRSMKGA